MGRTNILDNFKKEVYAIDSNSIKKFGGMYTAEQLDSTGVSIYHDSKWIGCIYVSGSYINGPLLRLDRPKTIYDFALDNEFKDRKLARAIVKYAIKEMGAKNAFAPKADDFLVDIFKSCGFKTYKKSDHFYYMELREDNKTGDKNDNK